jgi:CRISPR-associated protein Csm4
MQTLRFTLHPQTAFGTPLAGDTLFGQLCWTLRRLFGSDWLTERLSGYTEERPFLVVSDAFPQGFLPLPAVPGAYWTENRTDRKVLKKKRWLPAAALREAFPAWQGLARNDVEVTRQIAGASHRLSKTRAQPHNSINRATGTTGEGSFTPYTQAQNWFHPEMRLELYTVLDETRITADELAAALESMGRSGYGRDASIGLGKFAVERDTAFTGLPKATDANAFLTLAPVAPQGLGFSAEKSFYHPLTRFGRHGDVAVHSGNPFKHPLLLAGTGSVFAFDEKMPEKTRFHVGQGLSGISVCRPEAVAQGYAPVVGIRVEYPQ